LGKRVFCKNAQSFNTWIFRVSNFFGTNWLGVLEFLPGKLTVLFGIGRWVNWVSLLIPFLEGLGPLVQGLWGKTGPEERGPTFIFPGACSELPQFFKFLKFLKFAKISKIPKIL